MPLLPESNEGWAGLGAAVTAVVFGAIKGFASLRRIWRTDGAEKAQYDGWEQTLKGLRAELGHFAGRVTGLESRLQEEQTARMSAERQTMLVEGKALKLELQVESLREQNVAQALQIQAGATARAELQGQVTVLQSEVVQLRAELATKQNGH